MSPELPSASRAAARSSSAYDLRFSTADDRSRLVQLFNSSFVGRGVELPVDADFWAWRYGANGSPQHSVVAVHRDTAQVVGHVGSVPLRTWCRGETRRTTISLDHMIDFDRRRGLQQGGLLARMVEFWVDEYCRPQHDFLGWGFPNEHNFRLGHRFNGYSVVRNINLLMGRNLRALHHPHDGVRVSVVPHVPADTDALWGGVREELEMGIVRDAAYLRWRYDDNPRFRYTILEARDEATDRLRGLAVVRMGAAQHDVLTIFEWLLPLADRDACHALLETVAVLGEQLTAGAVSAWFPEGLAWFDLFQDLGFRVRFTPIVLVARTGDPGITIADVRQHFYATFGDVEYF